jgi:cellulose synthase/poly-beta-1,6-N-acetylglucosamine synthase-like glycosyltransferase
MVTVGVCAYNEGNNIAKILNIILNQQELSAESEVLVVCSGCTDKTVQIAKEKAETDSRVKVIIQKERLGKAAAVNEILKNATSPKILFVSADTLPNNGCFSKLARRFDDPKVGLVCGKPIPVNVSNSAVGRLVRSLWIFHDHVFHELNDAGLARHATEVFIVRKGIVTNIPMETVNDDAYIAVNTRALGWLIKYEPHAEVLISGPESLSDYLNQRRRIIFGHYQIRKLTGKSSQYLIHLAPRYPKKALQLAVWLCMQCGIPTFLLFTEIELLLNGAALVDFMLGKSYAQWNVATSTKMIDQEKFVNLPEKENPKIKDIL